ncbi:hypothetical protein BC833DRAFT_622111 [Globomyces pollinis-pini]|nr:hypothetical protein BC833DRAFT_622111 [Globomyces pollinis-pini]
MDQPNLTTKEKQIQYKANSNTRYSAAIADSKKSIKDLITNTTNNIGKNALNALLKSGYAILELKLSITEEKKLTAAVAEITDSMNWEYIFNTKFADENEIIQDTGRLQTSVSTSSDSVIILQQHISKLFGDQFQIFKPVYLMSKPGCEEQELHRDYKRNSISRSAAHYYFTLTQFSGNCSQ